MIDSLKTIGLTGFFDIAFMSLLIYVVIVAFKRTRAAFVLTGIFIIACIYLVTRQFNMILTAGVFERFFTIILIILVVIFQEELRHFFEEVAVWSLNRRLVRKKRVVLSREEVQTLARVLFEFARERIGALIVLRGKNILTRHLEGEVALDGALSEPLLKSIFDPHSIGHDGAVIIDRNRITHFSCHLPLSKNLQKIRDRGTRHAAALGLSEVSDALCLIVSEEKGTISVARNGVIEQVNDPETLMELLENYYEEIHPRRQVKTWEEFFKRNSREKVYAGVLAVGLWFVLVHGAKIIYKDYVVPVSHAELPEEWKISAIDPGEIEVRLRGPRKAFYLNIRDRIKIYPDVKIQPGSQEIRIHSDNFVLPKGLMLDDYDPNYIRVSLEQSARKQLSTPVTEREKKNQD